MFVIKKIISVLCGFFVGIINGMLGAGGGMLAVPLLQKKGLDQRSAHATSVAVIFPLSAFSTYFYLTRQTISISDTIQYIPAGAVGAVIGAMLLRRIPQKILRQIFGVFVIWAAVRLLLK